MLREIYAAMVALALLAGCALERPGVVRVTYDCDQGRGFVARYERDGQVTLELGEGERVLPEVAALAGTRYDDGTYELALRGRHATLRGTDATYSNCIARDWQEAPPADGPGLVNAAGQGHGLDGAPAIPISPRTHQPAGKGRSIT